VFSALEVVGVHAAYEPRLSVFEVAGCEVHCIPHMPTEEMMTGALGAAHRKRGDRPAVLVTHAGVKSTGAAFSMSEFNELILDEKGVAHLGEFEYVALGHYHRHLEVAPNAYYSGSTERFHKNEASYDKGFVEADVEVGAPGPKVTFGALEPRRMLVVDSIDCAGLEASAVLTRAAEALSGAAPLDGAIVYLGFRNVEPGAWINLDRAALRASAGDALHVEIDHEIARSASGGSQGASIGKLTDEFAAFLQRATKKGEVSKDVRKLADAYLQELLSGGAA
jgi:DNA repair exonuclease SbcCD nuclease subunit